MGPLAALCLVLCSTTTALRHGLMIDAGSSGSRIHLYEWEDAAEEGAVPVMVPTADALRLKPGLSSMLDDVEGARGQMSALCAYAEEHIQESDRSATPLYLKATAGLRLALIAEAEKTRALLEAVRDELEECSFQFERANAGILSGEEEGVFGWISANILAGQMSGDLSDFFEGSAMALDLGGASTQITLLPDEAPLAHAFRVSVGDDSDILYTHSYLQYGQDQAWARYKDFLLSVEIAEDPCAWAGWEEEYSGVNLTGGYNKASCSGMVAFALMGEDAHCAAGPCAMNGVYSAPVAENTTIYAFSAFYYNGNTWGCGQDSTVGCVLQGASLACNNMTWDQANNDTHLGAEFGLEIKCFAAHYIDLVLKAYGLSDDTPINFVGEINGGDAGWTLGAMVYEAGLLPDLMEISNPECPEVPPTSDATRPIYGLMVDAGSTKSSLFVYQWDSRTEPSQVAQLSQVGEALKVRPGLSTLVGKNASTVAGYLDGLCEHAKGLVPQEEWVNTRLFLKATAGLRVAYMDDDVGTEALLDNVRAALHQCPFEFEDDWATILPGEDEGAMAWLATNLLLGRLGSPSAAATATLDLGGASTQIAFISEEAPLSGSFPVLAGIKYPLYTHSFLGYGQDQFLARYDASLVEVHTAFGGDNTTAIVDACYWTNYTRVVNHFPVVGAYNAVDCATRIRSLMGFDTFCAAGPCSLDGVHSPPLPEHVQIYAMAGYYYAADTAGCDGLSTASCLAEWANETCGGMDWEGVRSDASLNTTFLLELKCFTAHYVDALLRDGYRLPAGREVHFVSSIEGADAGWALGAMAYEAGVGPVGTPLQVPVCPIRPKVNLTGGPNVLVLSFEGSIDEARLIAALSLLTSVDAENIRVELVPVGKRTVARITFLSADGPQAARFLAAGVASNPAFIPEYSAALISAPTDTQWTAERAKAQGPEESRTLSEAAVGGVVVIAVMALVCLAGMIYLWDHERTVAKAFSTSPKDLERSSPPYVVSAPPPASTPAAHGRFPSKASSDYSAKGSEVMSQEDGDEDYDSST